jgi:hypothetical protein
MKNFREFLLEAIEELEEGDYERHELPQLPIDVRQEVIQFLQDKGIKVERKRLALSEISPSQKHFEREKVEQLKKSLDVDVEFFVSSDLHLVDGHHRYIAMLEVLGEAYMPVCYVIDLSIPALVRLLKQFNVGNIQYKTIQEAENETELERLKNRQKEEKEKLKQKQFQEIQRQKEREFRQKLETQD